MRGCSCRGTAGFAHVSCLAEQAKILYAEAEDNHLDDTRFPLWATCGLCEQSYHGVVACALGWACWKTYVGRAETDWARGCAMMVLGNGLYEANYFEDALSVRECELAIERRLGASESNILVVQTNLAITYEELGRLEEALLLMRDVYSGRLRLNGEESFTTLKAANNYASSLVNLKHFEEAKSLMRKTIPLARRVLGENHDSTLRMRWTYGRALYFAREDATLEDLREAVTTLEDTVRIARRVLGGAHPLTEGIERDLQNAQAALAARDVEALRVGAMRV